MPARFVTVDRDTPMLLRPSLQDWVPADHLVHFIIDAVEQLDLRTARINEHASGNEQHPPATMLALLAYSYATGKFASRRIRAEQLRQRRRALPLRRPPSRSRHDLRVPPGQPSTTLQRLAQILELAARSGQLRVGDLTVAVDGTEILANASRHSAVIYERAGEQLRQDELEIEQLVVKAEAAGSER